MLASVFVSFAFGLRARSLGVISFPLFDLLLQFVVVLWVFLHCLLCILVYLCCLFFSVVVYLYMCFCFVFLFFFSFCYLCALVCTCLVVGALVCLSFCL